MKVSHEEIVDIFEKVLEMCAPGRYARHVISSIIYQPNDKIHSCMRHSDAKAIVKHFMTKRVELMSGFQYRWTLDKEGVSNELVNMITNLKAGAVNSGSNRTDYAIRHDLLSENSLIPSTSASSSSKRASTSAFTSASSSSCRVSTSAEYMHKHEHEQNLTKPIPQFTSSSSSSSGFPPCPNPSTSLVGSNSRSQQEIERTPVVTSTTGMNVHMGTNMDMGLSPADLHILQSLSAKERGIFMELKLSGFDSHMSVAELQRQVANNPNGYSFDTIMLELVAQIDNNTSGVGEPSEREEEEYKRQMDAAILLSEGERENIEARKRKRVEEMESDCTIKLKEVKESEFKLSVLIEENEITKKPNCAILWRCIDFLDSSSCGSVLEGSCQCLKVMKALRKTIVGLLLLERDAIKWWGKLSYPYLLQIASHLDRTAGNVLDLDSTTGNVLKKLVIEPMSKEVTALQTALFLCPETDGSAPKAFIEADPESKMGSKFVATDYNIEDDGFEVFEPEQNVKET